VQESSGGMGPDKTETKVWAADVPGRLLKMDGKGKVPEPYKFDISRAFEGVKMPPAAGAGVPAVGQTAPLATTHLPQDKVQSQAVAAALQEHLSWDAILAHPGVGDADKNAIRDLLKAFDDAMAKVAPGDLAGFQAEIKKRNAAKDNFLESRMGLRMLAMLAEGGASQEHYYLQHDLQGGNLYAALLKSVGMAERELTVANAIFENARPQAKAAMNADQGSGRTDHYNALTFDLHKAVRGLMAPQQNADLDWFFQKKFFTGMGAAPGMGIPVTFPEFPNAVPAPEDGKYSLKLAQQNPALKTVTLKKGQKLGFRKTDAGQVAYADKEEVPVPGETIPRTMSWQFDGP
jgi:hypothetical protein